MMGLAEAIATLYCPGLVVAALLPRLVGWNVHRPAAAAAAAALAAAPFWLTGDDELSATAGTGIAFATVYAGYRTLQFGSSGER